MTFTSAHAKHGTNLYEVLQVSPRASQDVIQAAYRVLARSCHPDVNPSASAAERMLQLNAAYDVLRDTQRRAEYDLQCIRTLRSQFAVDSQPKPVAMPPVRRQVRAAAQKQVSAPPPPKTIVAVAVLMVLTLALAAALFVMSAFLDDTPASMGEPPSSTAPASLRLPFEIGLD